MINTSVSTDLCQQTNVISSILYSQVCLWRSTLLYGYHACTPSVHWLLLALLLIIFLKRVLFYIYINLTFKLENKQYHIYIYKRIHLSKVCMFHFSFTPYVSMLLLFTRNWFSIHCVHTNQHVQKFHTY